MKINKTYSTNKTDPVSCQFNTVVSEFFWDNTDLIQRIFDLPKQARKKPFFRRNRKIINAIEMTCILKMDLSTKFN